MRNPTKEILTTVESKVSLIRRSAVIRIFGATKGAVADVMDAHLETLSMIFLTTIWATAYAWFEGTAEDVGKWFHFFTMPWPASLLGTFSTYHIMFGITVFAISFSFGFLKFTRMLWFRKRYMMFTALGNYPYAIALEDFLYFFFSAPYARLAHDSWTCSVLSLGCWTLKLPWGPNIPWNATAISTDSPLRFIPIVIPRWYLVAFGISALMFFLAYRSALVNLLVTREVMKEIGFSEKTRIGPYATNVPVRSSTKPPGVEPAKEEASQIEQESPPAEPKVNQIVDQDREELMKRLRERLARQGP